jgi:hypothetical protein
MIQKLQENDQELSRNKFKIGRPQKPTDISIIQKTRSALTTTLLMLDNIPYFVKRLLFQVSKRLIELF